MSAIIAAESGHVLGICSILNKDGGPIDEEDSDGDETSLQRRRYLMAKFLFAIRLRRPKRGYLENPAQ